MSITVVPYENLGRNNIGWLDARHHFSFGQYRDPNRMGFGTLRVINDDIVQPHSGFDTHPHENMEIITYVRSGAITHRDSTGNEGRTQAGDVQVMSAGSGIKHSEHNEEDEPTTLYQIWIMPREDSVEPRWDAMSFPKEPANDALPLLVSGEQDDGDALFIHADARMYGGRLSEGSSITQPVSGLGYLLVSEGVVTINGQEVRRGDGAEISDLDVVTIEAHDDSEVLLIDLSK